MRNTRITGRKKQSEEQAELFAVRVDAMGRDNYVL